MNSNDCVPVIFRRWRGGPKTVCALFPTLPSDYYGYLCSSYEHVGQHGGADYNLVMRLTRPVDPNDPDVLELAAELRQIGYELDIRTRRTTAMRNVYTENLRSLT